MKPDAIEGVNDEVVALIDVLHATGQRLEQLTAGEVDTVADRYGRTFLLQGPQDQLRLAEGAKQAAILNALPARIALLDGHGFIISVNEAWRQFGSANALPAPGFGLGRNYVDLCERAAGDHASEARQVAFGIRSVLAGAAKTFSLEYPCHSKDIERWFLLTATPLSDDPPNGAVVMHSDVTSVRKTEESLRISEMRFRQMADNIRDVFFLADVEPPRMLYISAAYEEIWGRSCASLYADAESWTQAFHPDDYASAYEKFKQGMSTGKFQYECRIVRPDGSIRWMQTRGFPVLDDTGKLVRVAGVAEDITGRKQAALALNESDRRFSDMLGNVQLISLMLDRAATITYCNDYLLRLTGRTREEAIGRSWVNVFLPPEARSDLKEQYAALLLNSPEAWHHENEIRTSSGERRLIRWNNSVLRSPDGDITGTASIGEDITDQKRAEHRVKYLNRVYAFLSGINTLIVRVKNREELFAEACRVAVDAGGFRMSWIGMVDRALMRVVPLASAGVPDDLLRAITDRYAVQGPGPLGDTLAARAIAEKHPVVHNDTANNPNIVFGNQYAERGIRSLVVLPLIVFGEAVGILQLYAGEVDFFHGDEMALLTELAGDISFALENISKQGRFDRLARIRLVSSEINAAIARVPESQKLFDATCRIAVEHAGFPLAWIGVADLVGEGLKPAAMAGPLLAYGKLLAPSISADVASGHGTNGRAFRENKPVVDNDMAANPSIGLNRSTGLQHGVQSAMSLPLRVEGAPVGVLALYASEKNYFDDEEIGLLTEVADNLSFALEHINRQQKLDKLARIRAVSSEINAAITRVGSRQELLEATCRIAVEQGGLVQAWAGILDTVTQSLKPAAMAGTVAEYARLLEPSLSSESTSYGGTNSRAFREKKPVVDNDMRANPAISARRSEALKRGIQAAMSLPLIVEGAPIGVLSLYAREKGYFDAEEIGLLTEVAGNISLALDNIEKDRKFARLSRIQAVTSSVNALIVRVRNRQELFDDACRIAVEHGGLRMAWIGITDTKADRVEPLAFAGGAEQFLNSAPLSITDTEQAHGLAGRAVRAKKPVISNDVHSDPQRMMKPELVERGINSLAVIPLIVEDGVVGVLALYAGDVGFFDDDEMKLLEELAGNIAFAIDHLAKQEQLNYLAYYDLLTGLANRSLFVERVASHMHSATAEGNKLGIYVIDLERFKNINDTLGQAAGDTLLRLVADWLTLKVEDASLVARVGADQFAVLCPQAKSEEQVTHIIEKAIASFLDHPFHLGDSVFRIAMKVGIALFPEDGLDADALFRNAEAALKNAKSTGHRFLFFRQKMTATVAGRLSLENQLRRALDNEEFVLHYQPKLTLATGKLSGAEALIRWNDPATGLVAPGMFIPILEQTGMIYDVGRWALRKAVEEFLRWHGMGLAPVRIAVNVSPIQLRGRGFVADVKNVLGVDPLAATGLELEITESVIMEDVKDSIASLSTLRAMGLCMSIDDFGTGFSSLSYLSKLPVDTLKIDRSFVTDMTGSPEGLALVSTIINLAHSLKLKVVAEGVETEEQSRLLRLLNCDEAQGFLFSKPVPADAFETRYLAAP